MSTTHCYCHLDKTTCYCETPKVTCRWGVAGKKLFYRAADGRRTDSRITYDKVQRERRALMVAGHHAPVGQLELADGTYVESVRNESPETAMEDYLEGAEIEVEIL